MKSLKLLFLSTPIGSLGTGAGGGVEFTLQNLSYEMVARGHFVKVVAPVGSKIGGTIPLVSIAGNAQAAAQNQGRNANICMPANSVLANMWAYARHHQNDYDLILNFAYDWLPLYLTPFFSTAVAHFITMSSCSNAMDKIVQTVADAFPHNVGFYTQAQAATFSLSTKAYCLGSAINLSLYQFCERPESYLTFLGRIAPEKGLEDAVLVAQATNTSLKILGKMENKDYWQQICQTYPEAPIEYLGFFSTEEMQKILRKSKALLMPHRWVEAFGNVAIEAIACGVPVIAYRRGGPSEIIRHGKTGWLVEPDSVEDMCTAVAKVDEINRLDCRHQAENEYSLPGLSDRFTAWFEKILTQKANDFSTHKNILPQQLNRTHLK